MAALYDFVVIGGGTAGLVVASRLSEDPSTSVLVLEAGADLTADPRKFHSSPQPGLNGRVIGLNQGKALGGSSSLNAHVFVPPFKGFVDSWEALGNPGWNWTMLKDYFSKAYSSPTVAQDVKEGLAIESWPELNETKGPIQTSFGNETHPIPKACMGRTVPQHIDSDGKRNNSASAYYKPVESRQNLHVLTNALVERVLFDESKAPKFIGVQYSFDGASKTFKARREVILAAGAF